MLNPNHKTEIVIFVVEPIQLSLTVVAKILDVCVLKKENKQ